MAGNCSPIRSCSKQMERLVAAVERSGAKDPQEHRIYDAFTGPTGMLVAEYMVHLVPGMQRLPIVMQ